MSDSENEPKEKKNQPGEDPQVPVEVRTYFVRGRNALVERADFGQLYMDYYLHIMQHGLKHDPEPDHLLKAALAALALHLASRPQNETTAWTINVRDPLANLFVVGSSRYQNITGRLFEPEGKRKDCNLFASQVTSPTADSRQSTVDFQSGDIFTGAEVYYKRSEQRPARYFRVGEEDFALVAAQPDCDMEWFDALDNEQLKTLDKEEELSLLERRFYLFDCGCDIVKILNIFRPYDDDALDGLFGEDDKLFIACPRCAARFEVSKEMILEYREHKKSKVAKDKQDNAAQEDSSRKEEEGEE